MTAAWQAGDRWSPACKAVAATMRRMKALAFVLAVACGPALLTGCAVVNVAGAAAGAAISVGGAVVSTGVKVTGKVIEKTLDAVTDDDDEAAAK